MRVFVALLIVITVTAEAADSIASDYLPPVTDNSLPIQEHISQQVNGDSVVLADDGYRYKVVYKLKHRLRRDVSELPANVYLPADKVEQPVSEEASVIESVPEVKTQLDEDGYHYKTVRRLKYRHRRDVNELPANEYLPSAEVEQPVPEEVSVSESVPEVKTQLDEDGYHYKTVRRLKYRHRRDVNELPANEYLPSAEVEQPVPEEVSVSESVPEVKTQLDEDGYHYKTVRRLKYRHRRDVNELPANEYLPSAEVEQPVPEEVSVSESVPEVKTQLDEDGYHYKTVRRLKYRHRRDVNELPANEYLPSAEVEQPVPEEVSVSESVPEVKTQLDEDGYHYKTVRRLKYRHRRDVNELPANEYLPAAEVEQPVPEEVSVIESVPEVKTQLDEDGYHYKTVRRLKYRHRRDVSELPANVYLPADKVEQPVPEEVSVIESVPEVKTQLDEDGYHYKTFRRLKYRHRRDVNELPADEYLPSAEVEQPVAEEVSVSESVPEVKTQLDEDGYHYKTVRRLKYRHRRDVNELPANEYLPAAEVEQPVPEEVAGIEPVPEVKTQLDEDGYHYKTVRRLKYRHRRDVSESPANVYLPADKVEQHLPEEVSVIESVPEVKTQLDEDGYHYKTVRRLKYRHRRDVNELPANEYLPSAEVEQPVPEEVSVSESVPEVKTQLDEDGYHYKTVRRLKYRHRRDVNELPANEYLPAAKVEQPVPEEVSVIESVPELKTQLDEDGYHYKTVRRLKYRHRRDVNELPANEYLPSAEVEQPLPEEVSIIESVPEVKTQLDEDGYHYKTVRRLKYRHRRDVSKLPANEYLPAAEVEQRVPEEVSVIESVPESKTQLDEDGYHYKTVRRLKYRHRRDVSELPANEYLPAAKVEKPVREEVSVIELVPEVKTQLVTVTKPFAV